MRQQAVIPIKRDDDISPMGPEVYFPVCPLCDNSIEETDNVQILISRGTVCLTHENCDEIEEVEPEEEYVDDESDGVIIDNDSGTVY